ncbi:MAG: hypothetical protein PVI90_00695 [Desulfobacteraceae bacterium]|jgi:hypothetical protein
MATLNPVVFYCFSADLAHGVHNFSSDTLKLALTNSAPTQATDDEFSDISEISAGDGYTADGETITVSSSSQTAGVYSLVTLGTVEWESTGTIGPFRYIPLYNDDATNDELISYYDIGSNVTLYNGDRYTLDTAITLITYNFS